MPKRLAPQERYRIALLGDFKEDTLRGLQIIGRKISKGFIRNGHDVQLFSYLVQMKALALLPGKKLIKRLTKDKADQLCCKLMKNYQPDLVLLLGYRVIDHNTIAMLREALPNAYFAGWYPDSLDSMAQFLETNQYLDAFMATAGGSHLADIAKDSNNIPTAFIPNPCDPDVEKPYPQSERPVSDLFFTGKYSHRKCTNDGTREPLLKRLAADYGLIIHGNGDNPAVLGLDYFRAISQAKIAISININNSFRMYHSDRLINYLGCGAFVLASYVPDSELLFTDHKHLRYFHDNEQCVELIDYYLKNEAERKAIAAAGMAHAHKAFNCQRIAKDIIDFLTTGTYAEPWRDIVA